MGSFIYVCSAIMSAVVTLIVIFFYINGTITNVPIALILIAGGLFTCISNFRIISRSKKNTNATKKLKK